MRLATITLGIALIATSAAADETKQCPVSGKPAKAEISLYSEGKLISFCCPNCRKSYAAKNENRISREESKQGWRLVFDGKNLKTFQKPTRDAKWTAKDGMLVGTNGPGALGSISKYDNFVFQTDARIHDTGGKRRANSGVFIRSTGLLALRGRWPDGHEVQIDHGDPKFWTGAIWKTAAAKKVDTKDGEWFQLRIEANGERIRVWVNGKLVTDHRAEGTVVKGPVSFQVHHPTSVVELKNVKIRPLALEKSKKPEKTSGKTKEARIHR